MSMSSYVQIEFNASRSHVAINLFRAKPHVACMALGNATHPTQKVIFHHTPMCFLEIHFFDELVGGSQRLMNLPMQLMAPSGAHFCTNRNNP